VGLNNSPWVAEGLVGGCRWRLWSTLTVLAVFWVCGGPILAVAQYLSHTPKIGSSSSVFYAVSAFLILGLPVTGVSAFFAYRNSRYWRKQRHYKEVQVARESKSEMQDWLAIGRVQRAEQRSTGKSAAPSSEQHTKNGKRPVTDTRTDLQCSPGSTENNRQSGGY